ncbi:type II toxin-antitoxin system PemK/MazF family toxin [Candidatus Berkiella cookevillensis]|uniref:Toxin MazF n=1 Tax=Candidatus Berkiella cookevillensis TaxID=437022 RepID=A0A0Q9Y8X7_9GAMM|nr:type II toxin-antitoxin system PemK/MazF family toxin [Candidatus Berkiella cookevillensis]MCS5707778.1 type II toxin-antitoxin system PemK/MazF family toxin [Candidatus Berkiella cookevillensis]
MHQRGEVYWVEELENSGSEIRKKRPWVIMGINAINRARSTIIAIPLSTSASERPPLSVKVSMKGQRVVAICDQIRAIDKTRFLNKVDKLSTLDISLIEENLTKILGLG